MIQEKENASTEAVERQEDATAATQSVADGPEVVANGYRIQGESSLSYEDREVQVSNVVVTKTDRSGFGVQDVTPMVAGLLMLLMLLKESRDIGDKLSLEGR